MDQNDVKRIRVSGIESLNIDNSLPQSIWNVIFDKLDNIDYLNISLVCKQWRNILHTSLESLNVTLGK